jgi:hypothetical protein
MKVKVLKPFADKITFEMHSIGEEITLPDDRANEGIKKGILSSLEKPKATKKKKED